MRTRETHPPQGAHPRGVGGVGWGGPAKGAGKRIRTKADAIAAAMAATPERRAAKIATAEELKLKLTDLAFHAEREDTQLSAAVALLNRLEGMPRASVDMSATLSLESLVMASLAIGTTDKDAETVSALPEPDA